MVLVPPIPSGNSGFPGHFYGKLTVQIKKNVKHKMSGGQEPSDLMLLSAIWFLYKFNFFFFFGKVLFTLKCKIFN